MRAVSGEAGRVGPLALLFHGALTGLWEQVRITCCAGKGRQVPEARG